MKKTVHWKRWVALLIIASTVVLLFANPGLAQRLFRPTIVLPDAFVMPVCIMGTVLLALYFLSLLWTLYGPRRSRDTSGTGCVSLVAVMVAISLMLALAGFFFHWRFLVYAISVVAIVYALFIFMDVASTRIKDWLQNRRGE